MSENHDAFSVQVEARNATIDPAYAMARGASEVDALAEIAARYHAKLGAEWAPLFDFMLRGNRLLVRRILTDTGAHWAGVSHAVPEALDPVSGEEWALGLML